jgi:aspartyl-tRNA(Asn)/glutamyl-tRNA(Gln) amidotransferase subunit B
MDSMTLVGKDRYEPVIGLEIHAELETQSKMFCACPVVNSTQATPNSAVCPICAGMPGVLPVINQRAIEFGLRVAIALECEIPTVSIFARKNYFYPDLPKGYQISQYEEPLARNGRLTILTERGERVIRIRRVHLEEDAGKLTHVSKDDENYSLVDLNRAGIPLLEIVTEPDLHSAEEVRACATGLQSLLRYLEVNSGDMQKGVMRIEPNVSVRLRQDEAFGTRSEIKNLNSFRALERSVAFEIQRQIDLLEHGQRVALETRGWDENLGETVPQRVKEEADDYRYFPEPDLPPLVVDEAWIEHIHASLPELPTSRYHRFMKQYGLNGYDASVLTNERAVADYYEQVVAAIPEASPKIVANWISGDLFALLNQADTHIDEILLSPRELAALIGMVVEGKINQSTARVVLAEIFQHGGEAEEIVNRRGLSQVSDVDEISELVRRVLETNPDAVSSYLRGKEAVAGWLFGQVMRLAKGQANPSVVQSELEHQLTEASKQSRN